jgi:hypothetical protein
MYDNLFGFGGFGMMFTVVPIFIMIIVVIVMGTMIVRGVAVAKDKTKPVIPARAKVVSKRTRVWGDHSRTYYYATFELENGERIEFTIPDGKIGYLVEGDEGILSFQGSLFVNFDRI